MKTAILNSLITVLFASLFFATSNADDLPTRPEQAQTPAVKNSRSRANLFECVSRVLSRVSRRHPEYSTTETTIYFCNTYSDPQIEELFEFSKLINFNSVVKELTVNTLAVNCASMLYLLNTPTEISCALNIVSLESRPPFHIDKFKAALLECRHNPALPGRN